MFGECGQGKSTTLNSIVELVKAKYLNSNAYGCEFKSKKSNQAVTSFVQQGKVGNMTLIDTPGLNDTNSDRSDKNIFLEMIKNVSIYLKDEEQGITSLILCIMPNASQRITLTTIQAILNMFLMLNSLDERI